MGLDPAHAFRDIGYALFVRTGMFFFRRLQLGYKYAWLIDVLMGSITRSGVSFMLHNKPELLEDDALRAVDMMFDNAQRAGDAERADRLAVVRKVLMDARWRGIDAAVAAIPPRGPLPFQNSQE